MRSMSSWGQAGLAVGISAAIALLSMFAGSMITLPKTGVIPDTAVTHSTMLILSLAVITIFFRNRFKDFGFNSKSYKFNLSILLWVLPTTLLALLSLAAPEDSQSKSVVADLSKLQIVLFVWTYASICEEVLTRGLLQGLLDPLKSMGVPLGRTRKLSMPVIISALFFGAMHTVLIPRMGAAATFVIILTTLLGLVAGYYREKSGSLIPAIIIHALFNVGGSLPLWIAEWIR